MFLIYRFVEGLEFGLDGISHWEETESSYIFYNEKGTEELITPKASLVLFRITEKPEFGKGANNEVQHIEKEVAKACIPEAGKQNLLEVARKEGLRFVVHDEVDAAYVLDTEAPSNKWRVDVPKGQVESVSNIVALANKAVEAEHEAVLAAQRMASATIAITITDRDAVPFMQMKRAALDAFVIEHGYKSVMVPVIESAKGDHLRLDIQGEDVFLRRCVLNVGNVQKVEASVAAPEAAAVVA